MDEREQIQNFDFLSPIINGTLILSGSSDPDEGEQQRPPQKTPVCTPKREPGIVLHPNTVSAKKHKVARRVNDENNDFNSPQRVQPKRSLVFSPTKSPYTQFNFLCRTFTKTCNNESQLFAELETQYQENDRHKLASVITDFHELNRIVPILRDNSVTYEEIIVDLKSLGRNDNRSLQQIEYFEAYHFEAVQLLHQFTEARLAKYDRLKALYYRQEPEKKLGTLEACEDEFEKIVKKELRYIKRMHRTNPGVRVEELPKYLAYGTIEHYIELLQEINAEYQFVIEAIECRASWRFNLKHELQDKVWSAKNHTAQLLQSLQSEQAQYRDHLATIHKATGGNLDMPETKIEACVHKQFADALNSIFNNSFPTPSWLFSLAVLRQLCHQVAVQIDGSSVIDQQTVQSVIIHSFRNKQIKQPMQQPRVSNESSSEQAKVVWDDAAQSRARFDRVYQLK